MTEAFQPTQRTITHRRLSALNIPRHKYGNRLGKRTRIKILDDMRQFLHGRAWGVLTIEPKGPEAP